MAEQSGFFDAHLVDGEYDRVYLAEHFAKYFASFIGNGIFGGKSNELMVRENETASMGVRVLSGQAWIDGYWYENDDEHLLTIDIADGVLHRIDSVVVRWNHSQRIIRLAVKKGVAATVPVAPIVQRDDDYYELKLADIYIKAGTTKITQSSITDKRLNTSECGLVIGTVQQLDAEEFGVQLETYIKEFIAEHDTWKNATREEFEIWADSFQVSYTNWFIQFKASCEAAVNNLLAENQTRLDKLISDGRTSINNVVSTGTTNINKVVNDGQTNIAKVVSDGQKNIEDVVSTGTTNINRVVTEGQAAVDNVVSTGTTKINNLVSEKEVIIDNLIETKTDEINEVISDGQKRFDDVVEELEKFAESNDVASLVNDVSDLKQDMSVVKNTMTESEEYKGCYYRVFQEEIEWINPPNQPGIEYKTTERWNNNKAVYQKIFYLGALSNKSMMSIEIDAEYDKIISIAGYAFDPENNMSYPFPIILNGLTPIAVISGVEGNGEVSYIIININEDLSAFSGYITVKYTKA